MLVDALRKLLADYWLPIHPKVRKGILFTFLGLVVVIVSLSSLNSQPQTVAFQPTDSKVTLQTNSIVVHVVGQVVHPGVYDLPANSRVKDAIIVADGFTPKADQASLNLARPLTDGEQLVVGDGHIAAVQADSKVNLNRATAQDLEKLPGIGPALAARIVDYRLANGSYQSAQDLGKVAGIGPKLLERLKPEVTF